MADDRILNELYSLPLEDFTEARNEAAARLSRSGKDASAREVKALRKPTLTAWAVNQLARQHPKELRKLLKQRDDLMSDDPTVVRIASAERRRLISLLTERARSILIQGGHSAGGTTLDGVSKTLLAGGTDDERALIIAGRLTRELPPSGFEGIFGVSFEDTSADEVMQKDDAKMDSRAARRAEDLARQAVELEAIAARLEGDTNAARKHADKLAQDLITAQRKATEARKRADEATDAL
jgi:hypothetical protein